MFSLPKGSESHDDDDNAAAVEKVICVYLQIITSFRMDSSYAKNNNVDMLMSSCRSHVTRQIWFVTCSLGTHSTASPVGCKRKEGTGFL